jgi:hypothetical protein
LAGQPAIPTPAGPYAIPAAMERMLDMICIKVAPSGRCGIAWPTMVA